MQAAFGATRSLVRLLVQIPGSARKMSRAAVGVAHGVVSEDWALSEALRDQPRQMKAFHGRRTGRVGQIALQRGQKIGGMQTLDELSATNLLRSMRHKSNQYRLG